MRQHSEEQMIRISASIPKKLHTKVIERAHEERRSLSSEIVILLEKALSGGN
jgi:hypothetical protein